MNNSQPPPGKSLLHLSCLEKQTGIENRCLPLGAETLARGPPFHFSRMQCFCCVHPTDPAQVKKANRTRASTALPGALSSRIPNPVESGLHVSKAFRCVLAKRGQSHLAGPALPPGVGEQRMSTWRAHWSRGWAGYPGSMPPSEPPPPQLRPGARRHAWQRLRAQRPRDGLGRSGARPRPGGPGVVPLQPPAAAESAQVAAPPPRPSLRPISALRPLLRSARPAPPGPGPTLQRPSARRPLPSRPQSTSPRLAARLGGHPSISAFLALTNSGAHPSIPPPPGVPHPRSSPGLNRGLVAAQDGRAACGTLRRRGPGPPGGLPRRSQASTMARTSSAASPSAPRRSPAPSAGSTW